MPDRAIPDGARVYLSRSRLPRRTGSILGEDRLERALAGQGFTVFHPQDHPLGEQLRVLSGARHLLGPEGSAFHLAGLVASPGQEFTLIRRRSAPDHLNIRNQIRGMGARVQVVDALAAEWLRPGRDRSDDMTWGEPDHVALSDRLLELGLIARPLDIDGAGHAAELDLIRQAHKANALHRVALTDRAARMPRAAARPASVRDHLFPRPQEG